MTRSLPVIGVIMAFTGTSPPVFGISTVSTYGLVPGELDPDLVARADRHTVDRHRRRPGQARAVEHDLGTRRH